MKEEGMVPPHRGCGIWQWVSELCGGVSGGENRICVGGFLSSAKPCESRSVVAGRWDGEAPMGDGLDDAQNSCGVDRPSLLVEASELVHQ